MGIKKAYQVDLTDLHAACEANYARLMQLFPDYETAAVRQLEVAGQAVELRVLERCRYTTIFQATQPGNQSHIGPIKLELRAYHDVRMLEVSVIQPRGQAGAGFPYPNPGMFQRDEKAQQNRFLAEWLEHCLGHGGVAIGAVAVIPEQRAVDS